MEDSLGIHIVVADHPSLVGDIGAFLGRLRREQRYFGPSARLNPKPSSSLIEALRDRGGFKMAAIECGQIVGLARIDCGGDLMIAIDAEHRGRGIGPVLCGAMATRARDLQYRRLVLRTTKRSRAAQRIGEELGAVVIERGRGRIEFIMDLTETEQTA